MYTTNVQCCFLGNVVFTHGYPHLAMMMMMMQMQPSLPSLLLKTLFLYIYKSEYKTAKNDSQTKSWRSLNSRRIKTQ